MGTKSFISGKDKQYQAERKRREKLEQRMNEVFEKARKNGFKQAPFQELVRQANSIREFRSLIGKYQQGYKEYEED